VIVVLCFEEPEEVLHYIFLRVFFIVYIIHKPSKISCSKGGTKLFHLFFLINYVGCVPKFIAYEPMALRAFFSFINWDMIETHICFLGFQNGTIVKKKIEVN
jgi:hypothetical protein